MASSIFVCLMHHDDEKLEKLLEVVKNWLKEYEVSWSANNNDTLEISNWEEGREEGDRCADVNSINFRLLNSGNAKGLAELISENGLDGTIMRASLERDRYTRKYIEMCIDGEWREIYSSQPENDFIEEVRISFCDDEYLKVYLDKIRKKISQTLSSGKRHKPADGDKGQLTLNGGIRETQRIFSRICEVFDKAKRPKTTRNS